MASGSGKQGSKRKRSTTKGTTKARDRRANRKKKRKLDYTDPDWDPV
jgi:hypothetical protein